MRILVGTAVAGVAGCDQPSVELQDPEALAQLTGACGVHLVEVASGHDIAVSWANATTDYTGRDITGPLRNATVRMIQLPMDAETVAQDPCAEQRGVADQPVLYESGVSADGDEVDTDHVVIPAGAFTREGTVDSVTVLAGYYGFGVMVFPTGDSEVTTIEL